MKVLVFASSAFPRWYHDPAPAFVYDLSKRLRRRNVDISVLVPHYPGSKPFEIVDGMRVYRFPYFIPRFEKLCYGAGILPNMKKSLLAKLQLPFLGIAEVFELWRVAKKEKPDLIHAHWVLPQGFVAAMVGKMLKIPVVITAHAGDVFPLNNMIFRFLSRLTFNSAAAFTVNSYFTKSAVAKIAKRPIRIIPMGVDLKLFSSASAHAAAAVRKKYGVNGKSGKDGKMLLFVGRLAEKKGVTYLIAAMKAVVKAFPNSKLVVVGDGPEKSALLQQSRQLGLSSSIIFAGNIPNTDLPSFYKASDVFVLPSIVDSSGDTEGLGVVLLEAIAAGTPVVASDVGGIPDIVIKNKTGLLVEQKNPAALAAAIVLLLKNYRLRKKIAAAAKILVEKNFSWEKITVEFAKIYSSIISS